MNLKVYSRRKLITPYDKELKYLESNGTQYIETGIIPKNNTGIYINATCLNSTDSFIVGLRNSSGNTRWCIGRGSAFYYGYGTFHTTNVKDYSAECWLNFMNDRKFKIKNTNFNISYDINNLSFTPTYNIRLFGSAGATGSFSKWSGRLYNVKITQASNLIMDFIPVRVGETGYMYDLISGTLFGNKGTGNFILGPDKL